MKPGTSGACAPRTACRSRTVRTARPADARIPARPGRTRKWPATWASIVTTQNLRVVQTDVERGLILFRRGAGNAGGWISVRDAVKNASEGRADSRQVPNSRSAPEAAGRSAEGRMTS